MTKYEIVEKIAREKKVEEFIDNTAKTSRFDLDDLANDIYLSLLQKDDELIEGLYDFTGNNQTPSSSQGKLKVHANFLAKVGDEISIGTNKGWTITT